MNTEERPNATVPAPCRTPAIAAPRPRRLGSAVRRVIPHHLGQILGLWLILTGVLVILINQRIKPTYESAGLLRIEPANRDLFNLGTNSAESFDSFLQTQVELIRSANVVSAALTSKKVAGTTLVREAKDPEREISTQLQVGIVEGTYLIRVALTSPDPEDGPVIVNEVVDKYIKIATDWSDKKNRYQIAQLNRYKNDLDARVERQEKVWLGLTEQPIVELIDSTRAMAPTSGDSTLPHAMQNHASLAEYRQLRERLFDTKVKLIETEALFKNRKAELDALEAEMEPNELDQRRIKAALHKDPEITSKMKEIDELQRKADLVEVRTGNRTDPAPVQLAREVETLKNDLRELIADKQEELTLLHAGEDPLLHELHGQIDSLRTRKSTYEKLLSQLQVTNQKEGSVAARIDLAREDLNTLRGIRLLVDKRIEQLDFDSRGEARIQQIEEAKRAWMPIKDARRKLWTITPVAVLALVLGLFLIVEVQSGPVTDRDEDARRVPVAAHRGKEGAGVATDGLVGDWD